MTHVVLRLNVFTAGTCGGGSGFFWNRRSRHADFLGVIRDRNRAPDHSCGEGAVASRDLKMWAGRQVHSEHESWPSVFWEIEVFPASSHAVHVRSIERTRTLTIDGPRNLRPVCNIEQTRN